ncbi:MAG: glycosyltransferase family 39 protein, partial [Endomicrobiia bacterium]
MSKKNTKQKLESQKFSNKNFLVPQYLTYSLVLFWIMIVVYNYFKFNPINIGVLNEFFEFPYEINLNQRFQLFEYIGSFFIVFLSFISSFGWGKIFKKIFSLEYQTLWEESLFSIAIGFVITIYFTLTVGWLGVLYYWNILIFISLGLLFAILFFQRKTTSVTLTKTEKISFLELFLVGTIFLIFIYSFITIFAPETFYDSLKYHLSVPKYWLQHNRIFAIPNFEYSFYPANIHILYLIILMFGNDVTVKLFHFVIGLLTAGTIYFWSKKYFSNKMSLLSVVIFFSVPFVWLVMIRSAIEIWLAFFETLAVLSMLKFLFDKERKLQWLIFSAIFCGTAIGGKYLSVYCMFSILVILLVQMFNEKVSFKKILFTTGLFVAITLLFPLPYLIRNYIKTGAMTYPFSASLKKDVVVFNKSREVEFTDPAKPERTIKNFLTLPWNIAMLKKTQEPYSGAVLLLLIPFAIFFKCSDPKIKLLKLYVIVYYFCWFMVRTYFRYIIPFIPIISLVFAYFLTEININKYVRNIVLLGIVLLNLSSTGLIVSIIMFT